MAGFQFDGIAAAPVFDPASLVVRTEPRRDDSFEDHLRRAEEPAASKRETKPISRPAAQSADPDNDSSHGPSSSENTSSRNVTPAGREASVDEARETDEVSEPIDDENATDNSSPGDTAGAINVLPCLPATDPTLSSDEIILDGKLAAHDESSADASAVVRKQTTSVSGSLAGNSQVTQPDSEENTTAVPNLTLEQAVEAPAVTPDTESSDERPGSHGRPDVSPEKTAPPSEQAALENETRFETAQLAVPAKVVIAEQGNPPRNAESRERNQERAAADKNAPTQSFADARPVAVQEPAQVVPAIEPTGNELTAQGSNPSSATSENRAGPTPIEGIAAPHTRLPQHLLPRSSESTGTDRPLTEAEQARFVQRVARAFQSAASQEGEIRLRLSPPELGALRLEVKVQGGVLSARVETETSTARTLLLENLPALRERLAEQNIRVEHFDVDIMSRQGGGQQGSDFQDRDTSWGASSDGAARFLSADENLETTIPARTVRRAGDGQLNVLV